MVACSILLGVEQQHAQIADAAHEVSEYTVGWPVRRAVEEARTSRPCWFSLVNLFVMAVGDTHASSAAAFVLINEHNALIFALVDQPDGQLATQVGFRQCSHRRGRYIMKVFSRSSNISFCMPSNSASLARWANSPPRSFPVGAPFHSILRSARHWPRGGRGLHARGRFADVRNRETRLNIRQWPASSGWRGLLQARRLAAPACVFGRGAPSRRSICSGFPIFRVANAGVLYVGIIELGDSTPSRLVRHVLQVTEEARTHLSRFSTMPICVRTSLISPW